MSVSSKRCREQSHKQICGRPVKQAVELKTITDVVDFYILEYRESYSKEYEFYSSQEPLSEAIRVAAYAEGSNGKLHGHQWHLRLHPEEPTRETVHSALKILDFHEVKNFDQLHKMIEYNIADVRYVGPVMVYDIALRLGAQLKIEPESLYLHPGIRKGLRAIGIRSIRGKKALAELPESLRKLKPREIEDCLCVCRKELDEIRRNTYKDSLCKVVKQSPCSE